MPDLVERLVLHARAENLFPRPGLALLAVSGGPDSVALLDLFSAAAGDLALTLAVAHVDHGIAAQSAVVAEQVMALAAQHGVEGHLRRLTLGPAASETVARQERYRALREIQRTIAADYLVTAHHADDQIETALFRFLRGSGPAGLAGMSARGPGGLVRPLLSFRRTELAEWLGDRAPVFDDPANLDLRHDRSWLRQRLLPALRERFGDRVEAHLLTGQKHAKEDRAAWSALLRTLPELELRTFSGSADVARAPLGTYDKVLSEALLRALAREAGCVLGPTRARRVRLLAETGSSGRFLELGDGWRAELVFERLRIRKASSTARLAETRWGSTAAGAVPWGDWEFAWQVEPAGEADRAGFTTWVFPGDGEIRAAQDGDRVFPLGGVGRRSVHRLLMEARVPLSERAGYPVIVRGAELIWVPGICRAAGSVPRFGETALRIDARHP